MRVDTNPSRTVQGLLQEVEGAGAGEDPLFTGGGCRAAGCTYLRGREAHQGGVGSGIGTRVGNVVKYPNEACFTTDGGF